MCTRTDNISLRRLIHAAIFFAGILMAAPYINAQPAYPPNIAYDIKVERIRFTSESVKLTWKMNRKHTGDFIVGRSEKEILTAEDALQAKLAGIFNPELEGILIDRDIQQGKKYYYIVLAKDSLLNRNIDIFRNVNYTAEPVSIYIEPDQVRSLSAEIKDEKKIEISWSKSKGDNLKYNLYRSRSPISSPGELEVSEKIASTDDDEFIDTRVEEYGSYYYAVSITDRSGIEYYKPKPGDNFTTKGVYIKGKTLTTPLNIGAFSGEKDTVIVKWEKSESKSGKTLQGYEIYRSDDIINSLLKLKFSKLIHITDNTKTLYTDRDLQPGKYFYAVFPRYSDGSVDVNFETDSNYTKTPIIISAPYSIKSVYYEISNRQITLKWEFYGNIGDETVSIAQLSKIPADSSKISKESIIGTENIKVKKFTVTEPATVPQYYGIIVNNIAAKFIPGTNITAEPVGLHSRKRAKRKTTEIKIPEKIPEKEDLPKFSSVDRIIQETFYKGGYPEALKELKKFITSSDNKYELSKAKLYIARSYIEMHQYREGIRQLESDDVKKYFPDEAKFWYEFAIVRLE